jgi:hypothetical protein
MAFKDILNQIKDKLYYSKTITISDIPIELRLLSIYEEQKLSSEAEIKEGMDPLAVLNEIRKMTLAYSIRRMSDEVFPDIIEIQTGDKIEKKTRYLFLMDILSSLPSTAIDVLFEAYVDLKEEAEDKFKTQYKYDWYKTPEQREAERVKKQEEERKATEKKDEEEVPDVNFKELPKEEDTPPPESK